MIFKFDDSIQIISGKAVKDTADLILHISGQNHHISCDADLWQWLELKFMKSYEYLSKWDLQSIRSNRSLRDITAEKRKYLSTVVVGYGDGMFTPPEAMELVRKPSLVIVENEANDWAVVRKWIDLLKKDRQYGNINTIVCQRKDSGYLRPYNAGSSGQIVNSIIQRQKEYHKGTGYKVTVLLDSDKTGPEDALSNEKEKIRQAMVDAGIEGHILYKREMENYFSESVYREAKMIQTDSVPPYSDEDWDFLDIEKAPFTKYKKKDLPTLVEYLDKSSLLKRVGAGRRDYLGEMMNEIQIIIMKLARLS